MIDKTQNPAEIYLVPVFDGEHDHVWCDTPAPGEGMREEDATRYVREDIYLALQAQVEAWKAISGKHLEVASDCIESNRRLLLKTFIAGCDVGHKYGENPFEHDRQFDSFMADLKAEQQKFYRQEIEYINFLNQSTKGIKMIKPPSPKQELEFSKVLHNRIEELEKERNELKAQVEQLHKGFSDLQSCHLNSEYYKTLSKIRVIFNATPAKCLAEIKAQAVIDAIDAHKNNLLTFDFNTAIRVTDLIKYANKLRQQAKAGA